jgi:anaerobic selenocysteine-containing dehydrogenase
VRINFVKFQIELYSSRLKELGCDPLPLYIEPSGICSVPELTSEYPLIITSRKEPLFFHTEYHNLPLLREIIPDPEIEVSPKTAESLGIKDGDLVVVESPNGKVKVKAKLNDALHPNVVLMPVGWPGNANFNLLTDDETCSTGIGSNQLRGFPCRIRKVY